MKTDVTLDVIAVGRSAHIGRHGSMSKMDFLALSRKDTHAYSHTTHTHTGLQHDSQTNIDTGWEGTTFFGVNDDADIPKLSFGRVIMKLGGFPLQRAFFRSQYISPLRLPLR